MNVRDSAAGGKMVGKLVDSTQADDRKMIRLVKERRLLYARNNLPVASYYTQVKRLWQEIATAMGWTVEDVRRKWSHIRNSYSRHLRNELHSVRTARGRIVSRWYLADELEFLREHMATDVRPSPYSTYAPSFLEMDMGEQSEHESVDLKPFMASPWFPLTAPLLPPMLEAKSPAPHLHNDDSSTSFGPDENSSYFQFFRGIYNDFQELPAQKQRKFKRQCLSYLHDLLDEEDSQMVGTYHFAGLPADGMVNVNTHTHTDTVVVKEEKDLDGVCLEDNEARSGSSPGPDPGST